MLHKKRDEEAAFQKKLAVTEYINLLPEIFLEDKNYVIWAYGQYILGKPANGLGNRAIYQPAAS